MAFDSATYHATANGIRDIYFQELNRAPDEGGWIEWFCHWREGGKDLNWIREQIKASPEYAEVHKPRPSLPRLVNRGGFFAKENGERFTVIGASDFNLFCVYLQNGPDAAEAIMAERAAIGFNWLRVWLAYWDTNTNQGIPDIGKLNPAEHHGMYDQLAPFAHLAERYGLYIEFTAFTGPHIPGHWDAIGNALWGLSNVVVELCNENDAHAVRIDPNAYAPLLGILCSHGSNGSQAIPPRPAWDYETMHHVNVSQWARKVGHNTMELTVGADQLPASRVPAISGENTRPDQDGNISHFYDAAAAAALLCAGSTFHSQSGKASTLFGPVDRMCAEEWVAGAKSVPLEFQAGAYRHAAELETGAWQQGERVYQRTLSDGRVHTVRIRA